jgi:hypothetical protein
MKKLFLMGFFGALSLVFASTTYASEGYTILTNRGGATATCWVGSVVMQNDNYTLLFSCRDITYPGGTEVFSYVLWSNPLDGSAPIKLGNLGYGKGEFKAKKAFGTLFVTKETSTGARTPEGPVVMQGAIQPLPGLQNNNTTGGTTQTPTASPTTNDGLVTETPAPTTQPRTGIAKFLTSGILAIIGLAGIIFILFIVVRRK